MIVRQFPFYVLGVIGAIGLLIGRFPCGWFCPFGWFQEVVYKLKLPKFSPPNWLRHAKFVVLGGVTLALVWVTFEPWFCKLCPAGTLGAGLPWLGWKARGALGAEGMEFGTRIFGLKLITLGGLVALMGMVRRPFCCFVCPLGALFGLTNRVSVLRLEHNSENCAVAYALGEDFESCDDCGLCMEHCPMDLKTPDQINSVDCIRCLSCTSYGSIAPRFDLARVRERERGGDSALPARGSRSGQ